MIKRIKAFFEALFYLPVAFYNIGDGKDSRKFRDFDELASTMDERGQTPKVIVFAEAADRHTVIREWCRRRGWVPILKRGAGAAAIAAVVHPDIADRITRTEWTLAVGETNVGNPGAGPAVVGDKTILWIRFGRGVRRMHILATHLTASIDRKELPNHEKRMIHARKHISVLWRIAKKRWGATLVLMDANSTWGNQIWKPMRNLGFVNIVTDKPTHGRRRIDLALFRWFYPTKLVGKLRAKVTFTKVEAVTVNLSSDHDGVIVRKV